MEVDTRAKAVMLEGTEAEEVVVRVKIATPVEGMVICLATALRVKNATTVSNLVKFSTYAKPLQVAKLVI